MQSTFEQAVSTIIQAPVPVIGSGRTDAGAHAMAQVVAFSADTQLSAETMARALNAQLPYDIAVTEVREVPDDFHPRNHALCRTYRYLIWNHPIRSPFLKRRAAHISRHLDDASMHNAMQFLIGRHDLSAFIPMRTPGNRERTIFDARCTRDGDLIVVDLTASGFMRQMVRAIVGTLFRVGLGKLDAQDFERILHGRQRQAAGDTAPAFGLYLIGVRYPTFAVGSKEPFSSIPIGENP